LQCQEGKEQYMKTIYPFLYFFICSSIIIPII
jgi:hypothetical protein